MQCDTKTQIWNSQYAGHFGGHWIKDGLVASSRPRRVGSRRTRPVCQRLSTCRSPTVRRDRYTQRKRPHSRRRRESGTDPVEEIREQKRQELLDRLKEGNSSSAESAGERSNAPPETPIHVDDTDRLSTVTARYDVVLVDFYAEWCGPCKQLEPTIKQVAAETDAAVAKVDIDRHQQLAAQYGVQSVPTMIVFSDGQPAERIVGLKSAAQLTSVINRYQ